jgi:hypothetical protein
MLDAYIIDRIRRERDDEKRDGIFVPIRIEVPRPSPAAEDDDREQERGTIIIDFNL